FPDGIGEIEDLLVLAQRLDAKLEKLAYAFGGIEFEQDQRVVAERRLQFADTFVLLVWTCHRINPPDPAEGKTMYFTHITPANSSSSTEGRQRRQRPGRGARAGRLRYLLPAGAG